MSSETLSRMGRRRFLQSGIALGALAGLDISAETTCANCGEEDRKSWLRVVAKVADPVLTAASQRRLKELMPVEAPHGNLSERSQYTHLEALGRLLTGMAPWLESGSSTGNEGMLRSHYADLARRAIDAGTDPTSRDFMNFKTGGQPVVDAAFLALAIVRAPTELWHKLDGTTQQNVIKALESTRVIRPGYTNWLLFSAMVEAALSSMGVWWDPMRVDYAIRSLDTWYKGDGVYGDGPPFHWDYYNSFVMQPMLLNILDVVSRSSDAWTQFHPRMLERARRYAAIQERMIAPDGSFPPIGRSLSYRFGAFHLLSEMALRRALPEHIAPEQVRSALTAVMRKMLTPPDVFDQKGWLTVGFYGHQPSIAEPYISTGSCYLCSAAWLPLGLSPADQFWSAPSKPWTSREVWSGAPIEPDHAQL